MLQLLAKQSYAYIVHVPQLAVTVQGFFLENIQNCTAEPSISETDARFLIATKTASVTAMLQLVRCPLLHFLDQRSWKRISKRTWIKKQYFPTVEHPGIPFENNVVAFYHLEDLWWLLCWVRCCKRNHSYWVSREVDQNFWNWLHPVGFCFKNGTCCDLPVVVYKWAWTIARRSSR